jgi:hypothetical protein
MLGFLNYIYTMFVSSDERGIENAVGKTGQDTK